MNRISDQEDEVGFLTRTAHGTTTALAERLSTAPGTLPHFSIPGLEYKIIEGAMRKPARTNQVPAEYIHPRLPVSW